MAAILQTMCWNQFPLWKLLYFYILLKFVPRGPIENIPALVQIMVWCRSGDKPSSEPAMAKFKDAYMPHSPSMS